MHARIVNTSTMVSIFWFTFDSSFISVIEMGCFWNMPANYDAGIFESCLGDNDIPMGVYSTSTW